ncbi:hypothetical protein SLS62_001916 [Diatrype stigma]|uniref:ABC1 atypical kinase-like domain-containing protein n=1 Tax=Diatrype stigma TaxID=117547 RepID=A0AAN9YVJ6_9PEZI
MRTSSPNFIRRLASNGRWTCSNCRNHIPTAASRSKSAAATQQPTARHYTTGSSRHSRRIPKPPRTRNGILTAAATGAAGAGALAFTDDIKYGYEAVERTGRVAGALGICINDYRTSLNQRDNTEDAAERETILKSCHKRCAERTLDVLEKNGGIFIKLGQHLSAMTYLLPYEWTSTFIPLQDQCPVSSYESIERMFREDTGEDLRDYFSDFAAEPIGAASLAQVHLATVKETGQRVAVKVQHPQLAVWAPLDLALTKFTFSTLKRFFPEYDLEWLSSEMEISLPQELDFQREAANAARTEQHFARLPGRRRHRMPLVIPDVLWARRRILVMANESGHRLDDLAYLDAAGIDRDEVSAALAHIFNEMIFGRDAPLHCDPHGGNIAVRRRQPRGSNNSNSGAGSGTKTTVAERISGWLRWNQLPNFEIILYDHGLYRDIPEDLRRSYAKMWLAVIDGDMAAMQRHAQDVAGISAEEFPLFASAITGRDFVSVLDPATSAPKTKSVLSPRTRAEKKEMGDALQEGLLSDLVQMLGRVPRVILLILKTNDLTRSLDESLRTRRGPARGFLILARYCARTVLREQVDAARDRPGGLLRPANAARLLAAWLAFLRVEAKLEVFELWLEIKRVLGFGTGIGAGAGGELEVGGAGAEAAVASALQPRPLSVHA